MATPEGADGNPDLIAAIRAAIAEAGGRLPFAHYMALALTHPVHGYYASGRGAPGREGADFLTAPETSPYFGRCLAVQVAECWRLLGEPPAFNVWEQGAGTGTLARALLEALREIEPGAYAATTYWLDDASAASLARARETVAAHADHVAWGAPAIGVTGIMLANEFADALPVHRVRVAHGELEEAYVVWDNHVVGFAEKWDSPSTAALAKTLVAEHTLLEDGQVAEICLALSPWMAAVAQRLTTGYVVVIDYGDVAPALYRLGRFLEGSLMCYHRHTANRAPYRHVGEQDMTAHVDFTALEQAAHAAGLRTLGLTTQAAFLASLGLGELLYAATQQATDAVRYIQQRNAVVRLIEPSAMGRNRVMILGNNVPMEPRLRGLNEPPI
ncbi:MAG: SAM-dependent methyltransferase [Thermomicrobia bacterium]|nr:SAM-dependent methyltransferase [Thermomicrobia bacterium]